MSEAGRHDRQVRLPEIGENGQRRLRASSVAVVGMGATGTHAAALLVRAGVGSMRLVDRDVVETSNLQRQALFTTQDAEQVAPKATAARDRLTEIDPECRLEAAVADLTSSNATELLGDVDLVLDGTDNFSTRFIINDLCVRDRKVFVYSGVVGTRGQTLTVIPPDGSCLRCYVPLPPAPGALPTCETAGVLGPAVALVASLAAGQALRALIDPSSAEGGVVRVVDGWHGTLRSISLPRDPACPCCAGRYEFLEQEPRPVATTLCGRDAVQLPAVGPVDLDQIARRWATLGVVHARRAMVRLELPERRVLVFGDGRSIIGGTRDASEARAIRARLLGA